MVEDSDTNEAAIPASIWEFGLQLKNIFAVIPPQAVKFWREIVQGMRPPYTYLGSKANMVSIRD